MRIARSAKSTGNVAIVANCFSMFFFIAAIFSIGHGGGLGGPGRVSRGLYLQLYGGSTGRSREELRSA